MKDLTDIYNAVKRAIIINYAQYTTYMRPDNINHNGGFIFGAWKVEVYVNKREDVWKYRVIQGENMLHVNRNASKKKEILWDHNQN